MSKFAGVIFFIFWLGISGSLAVLFGGAIHKSVQSGSSPWMYLIVLFPLCFVFIGIWGMFVSIKGADAGTANPFGRVKSKTEYSKSSSVGAFLFGLPFFLAGAGVMIFFSIVPTVKTLTAMNWERIPAEIVSSELKTNYDSDGNTYKAEVKFSYYFDGERYESDTYDFQFFSTSNRKSAQRKVDSAPVESEQLAYVNPKDPQEAVLSVKLSWLYLITFVFGSIFAVVGGGIIFGVFAGGAKGSFSKKTMAQEISQQGPTILKSRHGGPTVRFIGILVFTLIWNGVVYMLFTKDAPAFFKVIFGSLGIIMILFTIHGFLGLFNPRPVLEVESKQVRLGQNINLNWSIRGNSRRIKDFTIALIGQEEATYRRGTSSYTDREIFFEDKIVTQATGGTTGRGSQTISVPEHSMPTWKSHNNKIIWLLKVNGSIDKWPDIKEEYEIIILPIKV